MGANTSNLNQTSEAASVNWENAQTDGYNNGVRITKRPDGMEEIDLDIDFSASDSEKSITEVFQKLDKVIKTSENQEGGSSPFISTELYKKIMEGGNDSTSSPFISTEIYKKMMNGGKNKDILDDSSSSSDSNDDSSESSSSSSDIMRALSEVSLTSSDYPKNKNVESKGRKSKGRKSKGRADTSSAAPGGYGFSDTSSEVLNTDKEYFVGGQSTDTPYNVESSSINTSDINLVSVDSVNGRRYL